MRPPGWPSAWPPRQLLRGVRWLLRENGTHEGTRHRRRRLHRLESRRRAPRARRRRARARQLLDRQPREPRGPRRRGRRGRAALATSACTTRCAAIEVVYHLGALGSVPRSVQDPLTSSAVNVEGTLNVLLAARDEGVRRVVFSSSTSVYGSSRELPTREDVPARPDLAVRRREARRRALLHQLQPRLRVVRDGRAPLLQRLRPAAEPALAVRRGRAALHHRDRRRASRSRSTATASSRATSPTSRTSSTRRSARPTRRARADGSSTSPRARRRA